MDKIRSSPGNMMHDMSQPDPPPHQQLPLRKQASSPGGYTLPYLNCQEIQADSLTASIILYIYVTQSIMGSLVENSHKYIQFKRQRLTIRVTKSTIFFLFYNISIFFSELRPTMSNRNGLV